MFIVGVIVFCILIYIGLRIYIWLSDTVYHYNHPEKKKLNKRLLKAHLVGKYGKEGKNVYREVKKRIWEDLRIR